MPSEHDAAARGRVCRNQESGRLPMFDARFTASWCDGCRKLHLHGNVRVAHQGFVFLIGQGHPARRSHEKTHAGSSPPDIARMAAEPGMEAPPV